MVHMDYVMYSNIFYRYMVVQIVINSWEMTLPFEVCTKLRLQCLNKHVFSLTTTI